MNAILTTNDDGKTVYKLLDDDKKILEQIELRVGAKDMGLVKRHNMCVMQAVTWLSMTPEERKKEIKDYGTISYRPVCTSRAITSYMVSLNDRSHTIERQKLKQLIPDLMNTAPVVNGVVAENPEFIAAEINRLNLLHTYREISFDEKIELVREACAMYKTGSALDD